MILILRDVLERLERPRILQTLDLFREALPPGGVLLMQVPTPGAPFWGQIWNGDFTREIPFREGSLWQLFATVGFGCIAVYPAGPVCLQVKDIPRETLWRCLEAVYS